MSGTVAITMAGFGNRFREAGFDVAKYRIPALGRPLFDWSMLSLSAFTEQGWCYSFAMRAADEGAPFVRERCAALGITIEALIELDAPTDGQATTARVLAERADPCAPFVVYNIDTFVRPGAMTPPSILAGTDGWLPCFAGPGDGWSFARLADDGRVTELREKTRISPHATVGLYWFSSASLFLETYDRYFASGNEEKGERYIAPMYNQLIGGGKDVRIAELKFSDVGMLGTPAQVKQFMESPPAAALAMGLTP